MNDDPDRGFTTGDDVDEPGNAAIDVAQSQAEVNAEFEQLEQQLQTECSPNGSEATGRTPRSTANEATEREDSDDSDFLEYARHCRCGASFRSRSAFDDHVDDVVNGTGVCSTVTATDGGATVSTPAAPIGPEPSEATPTVPKLTTTEQMLTLQEEEQERFAFLVSFCTKEYQGKRDRRRTLAAIVSMDGPDYDDLAAVVGKSKSAMKKYVRELREADIVATQGQGSPAVHVVFDEWTMDALANHALTLTERTL